MKKQMALIALLIGMGFLVESINAQQDQFLKNYSFRAKIHVMGDYKIGIVKHGTTTILAQVTPTDLSPCSNGWKSSVPSDGMITLTGSVSNCIGFIDNTKFDFVYKPGAGGGQWQTVGDTFSLADVYALSDPDCCSGGDCAGDYKPGFLPVPTCTPEPSPTPTPTASPTPTIPPSPTPLNCGAGYHNCQAEYQGPPYNYWPVPACCPDDGEWICQPVYDVVSGYIISDCCKDFGDTWGCLY